MYISESDKALIRQLVEKQLRAFQEDNLEIAFSLTSPAIQSKFTQQDFMSMMHDQYGALVKPRSIMFRGFTLINNFPALISMVMDRSGSLFQAVVIVQHQPDYSWRIHGYELIAINEKII